LKELCLRICNIIQEQRNNKDEEFVKSVSEFINNNYYDHELSLENISRVFGVSPSYCNKTFKTYTGYTIIQYLDELRFEKAKYLLKNSDYKLQDILDKTGYIDKVNFIRKFKKKEGVTPIQYRTMMRISSNNISSDITL